MGNWADCLLLVGGSPAELDRFERAPAGPFLADHPTTGKYLPEDHDEDYQPEICHAGEPQDWPRMAIVEVEAPFRVYATSKKYGPPGRWLGMAAERHPQLRFALLWWDVIFDNCGHTWAAGDLALFYVSLSGQDFERFARAGSGWMGWITDAIAFVAEACPGDERIDLAITEPLLRILLPTYGTRPPGQQVH